MFTATDGIVLPTTVTGSWPRPRWFTTSLAGQAVSNRLVDNLYREQFLDANAALVSGQERAGLDILTNGDYHLDDDVGGLNWLVYNVERLSGVDLDNRTQPGVWKVDPGTLLYEVMGAWRFPAVVDRIGLRVPLEFDKLWRAAQGFASKPVKIGTTSAQVIAGFLDNQTDQYDDDRRQLIWDLAEIINGQLRALADAGCKVIQIEEPRLHFQPSDAPADYVEFLIDALNREMEGLEDCEVWVHTCWGNPNMQRVVKEPSYANAIEHFLYRVNCDVWTVEMRDSGYREIELFGNYRDLDKKIAVGMSSHRTLQIEESEDIADKIRTCLKYIDADKLVLSSDCGFGRQGSNRLVAYYKAASMVRAANAVRAELGVPVTEPRNEDPRLQLDQRQ